MPTDLAIVHAACIILTILLLGQEEIDRDRPRRRAHLWSWD